MAKFGLSVLDLSPVASGSTAPQALRNTIELAQLADRLGYTRYWLAEHHNMPGIASTAPEIMIGQVARETTRIRVGSGGIMLPNHAPLKVAEWFLTLSALFPGRIDLGIGRAPGTDPVTALALRRSEQDLYSEDFPEQLADLLRFAGGRFPDHHPFRAVTAGPRGVDLPPIWLLGSSGYSAELAASMGLGFAHAYHINPHGSTMFMRQYREKFTPSAQQPQPHTIITAAVICADTDDHAEYLSSSVQLRWAMMRSGRPGPLPSPEEALAHPYTLGERTLAEAYRSRLFVGSPATLRSQLLEHVEQSGAEELMVVTMIHDHAERLRSYELLAEALGQ